MHGRVLTVCALLHAGCMGSYVDPHFDGGPAGDAARMDVPTMDTRSVETGPDAEAMADAGPSGDAGGERCAAPMTMCGGTCTALEDNGQHCGACDNACAVGEECMAGRCEGPRRLQTLSGGLAHACTIRDGAVMCWGHGNRGQLGDGGGRTSRSPVMVDGLRDIIEIQARDYTTCGRNALGEVWCWGDNAQGESGDGGDGTESRPVRAGVDDATFLALGLDHGCILDGDGRAHCWGSDGSGRLGPRSNEGAREALLVEGLENLVAIDAGNEHTCALGAEGDVYCWGDNDFGQLGDGGERGRRSPERVPLDEAAVEIALGRRTSCARVESGDVYCWGANHYGEVRGADGREEIREPTQVLGLEGLHITQINCGGHFACALGDEGELRCWGDSRGGQQGVTQRRVGEARVVAQGVSAFDALGHNICFVREGAVFCQGKNDGEILGDGGGDRTEPVEIDL